VHNPNIRMAQRKGAAVGVRDEEHGILGQDCPDGLPVLRASMLEWFLKPQQSRGRWLCRSVQGEPALQPEIIRGWLDGSSRVEQRGLQHGWSADMSWRGNIRLTLTAGWRASLEEGVGGRVQASS